MDDSEIIDNWANGEYKSEGEYSFAAMKQRFDEQNAEQNRKTIEDTNERTRLIEIKRSGLPNGGRPGRRQAFDGTTMPFGKHNGMKLCDVPVGYIGWIFEAQIAGEMAQTDALNAALITAFVAQVRAIPAVAAALDKMLGSAEKLKGRPVVLPGSPDSEPV
jgi:hypothetical protein